MTEDQLKAESYISGLYFSLDPTNIFSEEKSANVSQKKLRGKFMKSLFLTITLMLICNTVMADTEALESNKKLVVDFYTAVLFHGRADAIDQYIGDVYIQHNPNVADGKEALRQLIESFPPREKDAPPSGEIVRVVAEDDLVVLHVKNYSWPSPNGGAIVDIFRVENNKIVEHWDVVQAIPESSKNNNTMF